MPLSTTSASTRSPDLVALAARRAKAGDTTAVRFLRIRLMDEVIACLRDAVGDEAAARGLADSVFARLPKTIGSYEPQTLRFDAWLFGVARAAAGSMPEPAPESIAGGRAHAFREAFWRLSGDQREVLVLRHLVGLSTDEVADRLGKSRASVRRLDQTGRTVLDAARGEVEAGRAVA